MKKLLLSFLSLLLVAGVAFASTETAVLKLGEHSDFNSWKTNSYETHTLNYDIAKVTFNAASKQTGTITDCPVMKKGPARVTFADGLQATHIKFNFKKWSSKTKTLKLENYDPATQKATDMGITSSNFVIESDLANNILAIQVNFSEETNQVGLESIEITYEVEDGDTREDVTLSFPEDSYSAILGQAFAAPELIGAPEGAEIVYTSSDEAVATVAADGTVTLVADGTTTITASFDGNDTFRPTKATYTLKVIDSTKLTIDTDSFDNKSSSYSLKTTSIDYITYSGIFSCSGNILFNTNNAKGGKSSELIVSANPLKRVIKSITINAAANSDISLLIYKKATPFESTEVLSAPNIPTDAEKIKTATITKGTSQTIEINDVAFAIWPSTTGTMYIESVQVAFTGEYTVPAPVAEVALNDVTISVADELNNLEGAVVCYAVSNDENIPTTFDESNETIVLKNLNSGMNYIWAKTVVGPYESEAECIHVYENIDTEEAKEVACTYAHDGTMPQNNCWVVIGAEVNGKHYFMGPDGKATLATVADNQFPGYASHFNNTINEYRHIDGNLTIKPAAAHVTARAATNEGMTLTVADNGTATVTNAEGTLGFDAENKVFSTDAANKNLKVFATNGDVNTGVDNVAAGNENAPVEYYNLQGVRIENPAKGGLYIKRQGTTVTKVAL